MDAQNTINEVVEGVKSEGLFDQFRKECLEEFENMETYHQLKQRVENHVTSFLSKHKYHDGLQKNTLRSNLRNYISKSDVLLNSITQLVDEVLSLKGKSFCLRIDKQVDKHLCKNVPLPSPVQMEPLSTNNSDKPGQSDLLPLQVGLSMDDNNVNNVSHVNNNFNDNVMVEVQKEILSNETVTEFTEMEIEEVEMDISENQEVDVASEDEQINEELSNDGINVGSVEYTETHVNGAALDIKVKIEDVSDFMDQAIENSHIVSLNSTSNDEALRSGNEIKIGPENIFQPILVATENVGIDIVIKEEPNIETDPAFETNEYERITYDDNDGDIQSSLNLPPIITEPITDDSNSNDSTFADNIKPQMNQYMTSQIELPEKKDDSECRRKSSRVRTLPLKFREIDELKKRGDDADSVSSNDIDYKDLEDGTYLTGKRGRPRKRPQSAGNPETAATRNERRSSLSRVSVENARRRKRSPSISKQEEEAINFLTKPDIRKSLSREGTNSTKDDSERNPRTIRERTSDPRESRDGNASDKDDDDRYSRSGGRRKSESKEGTFSEKDDRKSERDRKSDARDGSSSSKDEGVKNRRDRNTSSTRGTVSNKDEASRNPRSKRDRKSESGEGSYSSIDDDDKNSRNKRDGTSSGKDSEDRKSRDRRDRKSSGSGKDEDSTRVKRENKSDTCVGGIHSGKHDPDRKSRSKREENVDTREERDSHRNIYRRKRCHSPAPSTEDSQSKRSRRSIKQRQRYSPP